MVLVAEGRVVLETLMIERSHFLVIEGFEITGSSRGITLGACDSVVIRRNYIHDITNYGIMNYRSDRTLIEHNRIERSSIEHGIYLSDSGTGVVVSDNFIAHTQINGIHMNGALVSPVVRRNVIFRSGTYPAFEGGAGITYIGGASDGLITNNLLIDVGGQGMTVLSSGAKIRNNVLDGWTWSGILTSASTTHLELTNNIFVSASASPLGIDASARPSLKADYNFYVLGSQAITGSEPFATWQASGQDMHGQTGASPFAHTNAGREPNAALYALAPQSSAVDTGAPELEDAFLPPGLGERRSDLGIFGGPDNNWTSGSIPELPDGGVPGPADSSTPGPIDATSVASDSGLVVADAGATMLGDVGPGATSDAASSGIDAGERPGVDAARPPEEPVGSGCGCGVAPVAAGVLGWAWAGVPLLRWRRGRRQE
ncbi:MAG: right-handed parallel beta-helix repeat-containing protein [Deltaproteobacteria bacterium]|nr:right-handed parallel beta-helix repeat-containing protein [Deltaproteobacteria bacterium]